MPMTVLKYHVQKLMHVAIRSFTLPFVSASYFFNIVLCLIDYLSRN